MNKKRIDTTSGSETEQYMKRIYTFLLCPVIISGCSAWITTIYQECISLFFIGVIFASAQFMLQNNKIYIIISVSHKMLYSFYHFIEISSISRFQSIVVKKQLLAMKQMHLFQIPYNGIRITIKYDLKMFSCVSIALFCISITNNLTDISCKAPQRF